MGLRKDIKDTQIAMLGVLDHMAKVAETVHVNAEHINELIYRVKALEAEKNETKQVQKSDAPRD
jgi:hypothetical protein